MDQREALSVLIQAANVAQSKGVFNLQEASAVATAVSTFVKPPEDVPQKAESTEQVDE
tara:strand:+ start:171 stop:344 length:174 start_codon:yes stop_codon:yes gene_type:complete